ncbi:MAG: SpoIVB peptidase [Candidatus Wallacebacter cryptica]
MKKSYYLLLLPGLVMLGLLVSPVLASWAGIPGEIRLFQGTEFSLTAHLPFRFIDGDGLDVTGPKGEFFLRADQVGKQYFQVRLFGFIPIREMVVDVVPEVEVFPGGHSIGVLVKPIGLVISRIVPVRGLNGREYYPAAEAGLEPGDLIISIGGRKVTSPEQVGQIVNELAPQDSQLPLVVQRHDVQLETVITPVLSMQEDISGNPRQVYLLGVFLEDPASGVGTLTFFDKNTGKYGALGHTITDSLGRSLEITDGSIVSASIESIKQGFKGLPGEKLGVFIDQAVMGSIDKNSKFGIFGRLSEQLENPYFNNPIPIALNHEVKVGPAKIYTVVNRDEIQEFDIEITRVYHQSKPDDKGMVIRVVDPELLQKTGGIIQGMSGSPIVQDGKLVGAITHVFVNDPRMGYGGFIEWMIYESGIGGETPTLASEPYPFFGSGSFFMQE